MNNDRVVPIQRNPSVSPRCTCCYPNQTLVVTGQRGYCPLTEKIYEDLGDGNYVRHATADPQVATAFQTAPPEWQGDFYPGRAKRRGDIAPLAINPAEDRFGA
jgi:hypothetical protein